MDYGNRFQIRVPPDRGFDQNFTQSYDLIKTKSQQSIKILSKVFNILLSIRYTVATKASVTLFRIKLGMTSNFDTSKRILHLK